MPHIMRAHLTLPDNKQHTINTPHPAVAVLTIATNLAIISIHIHSHIILANHPAVVAAAAAAVIATIEIVVQTEEMVIDQKKREIVARGGIETETNAVIGTGIETIGIETEDGEEGMILITEIEVVVAAAAAEEDTLLDRVTLEQGTVTAEIEMHETITAVATIMSAVTAIRRRKCTPPLVDPLEIRPWRAKQSCRAMEEEGGGAATAAAVEGIVVEGECLDQRGTREKVNQMQVRKTMYNKLYYDSQVHTYVAQRI
mmetsp:Transcript_17217/g.37174  ORF Transcript_17217/g.37174 Transcript_17217/m.37174 type:complete len:257 (+) Transcript_17217:2216-2986(+)